MTDPISDFLIRIKNAYLARHDTVNIPYSLMKQSLAAVLINSGYLGKSEMKKTGNKKTLQIKLLYINKEPKLTDLEIVSKPGRRIYIPYKKIPKVLGGMGTSVLSTTQGIMSGDTARKKKIGGELICNIC